MQPAETALLLRKVSTPHFTIQTLPFLLSNDWDTRVAASQAVEAIADNTQPWKLATISSSEPHTEDDVSSLLADLLSFDSFDFRHVAEKGKTLLSSEGSQFDIDLSGLSRQERIALYKKNIKQRLGIDDRLGVDTSSLFTEDDLEDVTATVKAEKAVEEFNISGLSARERIAMKRRAKLTKKSIAKKAKLDFERDADREPVGPEGPDYDLFQWPFQELFSECVCEMFNANWNKRHGALLGLKAIIKRHGAAVGYDRRFSSGQNEHVWAATSENLSILFICLLVLDRFADYVSDSVVAPVRETCAQCLGTLLIHLGPKVVANICSTLLDLAENDAWAVRHGMLTAIKYFISVRPDIASEYMHEIANIALSGLQNSDDDVKRSSALILVTIFNFPASETLGDVVAQISSSIWRDLRLLDDISGSVGPFIELLALLAKRDKFRNLIFSDNDKAEQYLFLLSFIQHPSTQVRLSVLQTCSPLSFVLHGLGTEMESRQHMVSALRLVFQTFILGQELHIQETALHTFSDMADSFCQFDESVASEMYDHIFVLCTHKFDVEFDPKHFVLSFSKDSLIFSKSGMKLIPTEVQVSSRVLAMKAACSILLRDSTLVTRLIDSLAADNDFAADLFASIVCSRNTYSSLEHLFLTFAKNRINIDYPIVQNAFGRIECMMSCHLPDLASPQEKSNIDDYLFAVETTIPSQLQPDMAEFRALLSQWRTTRSVLLYSLRYFDKDATKTLIRSIQAERYEGVQRAAAMTLLYLSSSSKDMEPFTKVMDELAKMSAARPSIAAMFHSSIVCVSDEKIEELPEEIVCSRGISLYFEILFGGSYDSLSEEFFAWSLECLNCSSLSSGMTLLPLAVKHLPGKCIDAASALVDLSLLLLEKQGTPAAQIGVEIVGTLFSRFPRELFEPRIESIIKSMTLEGSNRHGIISLATRLFSFSSSDMAMMPYVILFLFPSLRCMNDPDGNLRSCAMTLFSSLMRLVPLRSDTKLPENLLAMQQAEYVTLEQLTDSTKAIKYEIPVKIDAELRKYQREGVNWLMFLNKYNLHGVLCDDMGLGKTLQSICAIAASWHEAQAENKPSYPSIVVCPNILVHHWKSELEHYCPALYPCLYSGSYTERRNVLRQLKSNHVLIVSYERLRADIDAFEGQMFGYCILDEGHIIRNASSKTAIAVKRVSARFRLVLTGTPIQNNVTDLWSIFDFLMPGYLGSEAAFNAKYTNPISQAQSAKCDDEAFDVAQNALELLHRQVLPFLLRRMKGQVLDDLPPKIVQDILSDMSEQQQSLYDEYMDKEKVKFADLRIDGKERKQCIFEAVQYMRRLFCHPSLVTGEPSPVSTETLLAQSPKLSALNELLNDCGIGRSDSVVQQHRILLFVQSLLTMEFIDKHFLSQRPNTSYLRLDGSVEAKKRFEIVKRFNGDPSIDILLLTTNVGGLGLNLTGADTVIFLEHDWNPMKDLQAMDRAHRLGQKCTVNVYRLITRASIEEKTMSLQRWKIRVADTVVTQQNASMSSMDTGVVLDLLKSSIDSKQEKPAIKPKPSKEKPLKLEKMLDTLNDDWEADEYDDLDLDTFLDQLQ